MGTQITYVRPSFMMVIEENPRYAKPLKPSTRGSNARQAHAGESVGQQEKRCGRAHSATSLASCEKCSPMAHELEAKARAGLLGQRQRIRCDDIQDGQGVSPIVHSYTSPGLPSSRSSQY
jgi:hypothetical protein